MVKKAIILCGGNGTRLSPITKVTNKQLINVYDKPMFYYPLSLMMLCGIKNFLFITNKDQSVFFDRLIGNTMDLGIKIKYLSQEKPGGLPEAFIIGEEFIGDDDVLMILGDNFFYGSSLINIIKNSINNSSPANIYVYPSTNPSAYGVVELDANRRIKRIVEKPKKTTSNIIITGLYKFDKKVAKYSKKLKQSSRNELEIVDLIKEYHNKNQVKIINLGRGSVWMDVGNFDDLQSASTFIKNVEDRQGLKIGCLEEISYNNMWINKKNIYNRIKFYSNSKYSSYLKKIIKKI